MIHVAELHLLIYTDVETRYTQMDLSARIKTATNLGEIDRHLNLSSDLLYDRVQEHVNNALRQITNQLDQLRKEANKHVR